jgi:signal peptidase I
MTAATVTSAEPRRRSRLVAGLLSLIAPGVGHLYIGRQRRAVAIIAASILIHPLFAAAGFAVPPTFHGLAVFGAASLGLIALLYVAVLIDAVRLARRSEAPPARRSVLLAAVLVVWAGHWAFSALGPAMKQQLPWRTFSVASQSMQPTLLVNEWLIGDTRYYAKNAPARGDIVLYRYPADETTIYIKRVIGLPGDRVAFRENRAIVNGVALNEPYADFGDTRSYYASTLEVTVPAGHLFVAGDNRANSSDSRVKQHGTVPMGNLVARATEIFKTDDYERAGLWVGTPK